MVQELGHGQVRVRHGEETHSARIEHAPCQTHSAARHAMPAVGFATAHNPLYISLNGLCWHALVAYQGGAHARWHVQLQGEQNVELWLSDQSYSAPASGRNAQAASMLRAPFNGKLIALHVREGDSIKQGEALLVIESMKIEHTLTAPRNAVVHSVPVSAGQQVGPGQLLVQWKDAE